MIVLFIDTSGSDVSIALVKDNVILSKIVDYIPNSHSIYTVSYIDKVLKDANVGVSDVDKIMVVNGPGSFTGIRIGVTIAKVYGYLEKIDVICVSSLKMRAISSVSRYVLSLIDAHHNNYYMGLYDGDRREVVKEGFYSSSDVLKVIDRYNPVIVSDCDIIVGDDIRVRKQELDIIKIVDYYKDSEVVNIHLVNPNYLKLPQALEELK